MNFIEDLDHFQVIVLAVRVMLFLPFTENL